MDRNILYKAIDAALKAGREIMSVYTDPDADFEIERKADNSPLTIADRKSHSIIAEMLSDTPYPLLSEEGRQMPYDERKGWGELWLVDPLDGTKEFIKRNGEFTVNIAYIVNGVPEAGVIYVPVKHELYFGDMQYGAWKIEGIDSLETDDDLDSLMARADRLPKAEKHEGVVVVASRSHLNAETADYIRGLEEKHGDVTTVTKGSSLKLCLIAEGAADVYPRFAPTMEWDTAAGHAIVRAAGREVYQSEKSDVPLRYNKENLLNPWFIAF